MKKHLVMIIILLCTVVHGAWAQWSGNGTEEDPYLIYNNEQLDRLADFVNTGTSDYSGKYFIL